MTHFVAKTILVRRRKAGKNQNPVALKTAHGFSSSAAFSFSLERLGTGFRPEDHVSAATIRLGAVMSAELRIARAFKRLQMGLDEISAVSPEHFPNPALSARIVEGIFNFIKKKIRFVTWLRVLTVCRDAQALEELFREAFEYVVYTLPKDMEEKPRVFEAYDMTDKLTAIVKVVKSAPEYRELANNRIFQFQLVDFELITAPSNMLHRPESLRQMNQVTYYLSLLGFTCAFAVDEDYVMNSLEKDSYRALSLLRFDLDIWGRMITSRKALELSQRVDVDFSAFRLESDGAKADCLVSYQRGDGSDRAL